MVMAGLERPDSGQVVVKGTPFNALDEDALARFRGRQVGIVFQSFQPDSDHDGAGKCRGAAELAGNPDASQRAAQELTSVGPRRPPASLSDPIVRRRAAARGACPRAGARSGDPGGGRAHRKSRRSHRQADVDLLFTKHAERGMTLCW